eukprot:1137155-Pelagomonas_calceolata.AAC.5
MDESKCTIKKPTHMDDLKRLIALNAGCSAYCLISMCAIIEPSHPFEGFMSQSGRFAGWQPATSSYATGYF